MAARRRAAGDAGADGDDAAPDAAAAAQTGGSSKAETAKKMFMFNVSGAIGTALFYGLYNLLLPILEGLDIFGQYFLTVTWTVSYLASIVWQHSLHRWLVFGFDSPYLKSLIATYAAYSASLVLSSLCNAGMVMAGLGPQVAYWGSLLVTGVLNYFMVASAM